MGNTTKRFLTQSPGLPQGPQHHHQQARYKEKAPSGLPGGSANALPPPPPVRFSFVLGFAGDDAADDDIIDIYPSGVA